MRCASGASSSLREQKGSELTLHKGGIMHGAREERKKGALSLLSPHKPGSFLFSLFWIFLIFFV